MYHSAGPIVIVQILVPLDADGADDALKRSWDVHRSDRPSGGYNVTSPSDFYFLVNKNPINTLDSICIYIYILYVYIYRYIYIHVYYIYTYES